MLRPRFYTVQPLSRGASLELESAPSRHAARALRLKPGDRICLFDGRGHEAAAEISDVARDAVTVVLEDVTPVDRESPLAVTLAVGLSRGDRMDLIVQKATELGVASIRPIVSERSGVRLAGDRLDKKLGHWQRIVISACEQCGRNRLPTVAPPVALGDFLAEADTLSRRFILHPATAMRGANAAEDDRGGQATVPVGGTESVRLLVGPEGGFSDGEVGGAIAAGFDTLQLGPRVLRAETAPLAAVAMVQARWGDLRFPPDA